ncbi:MAG: Spy/CpxP family protein refolding chaperone [Gemmatimonadales bacterium]
MSKIRTAALGAVVALGLATFAGAQVPAKPDSAHRGMRDGGQRRGMMDGRRNNRGGRGGMGRDGFGGGRLMKDLNLTDAQKTRIKTVHEKYQPQYKTLREQGRTQFESLRGQKRDTTAAARQRFQQQREQFRTRSTAIRTQEQNEIRGILTADQRAKWDVAATQRKQRMEGRRRGQMKQQRRGGGEKGKTKA